MEELFAGRNLDLEAMYLNMKHLMDEEGLPYSRRSHTYNSRLAQELAKWADAQAGGAALHDAFYTAYFVDGINLADPRALLGLVDEAGLDAGVARDVLVDRAFAELVNQDWQLAHQYGVTGVPTFVADGRAAVGAQDYEILEQLVIQAGAEKRSAS